MDPTGKFEKIDRDRRGFLGTAAATLAAAQFMLSGSFAASTDDDRVSAQSDMQAAINRPGQRHAATRDGDVGEEAPAVRIIVVFIGCSRAISIQGSIGRRKLRPTCRLPSGKVTDRNGCGSAEARSDVAIAKPFDALE